MTVQLNWPPDVVDRLTEEARRRGLSLDEYLLQVISQRQVSSGPSNEDELRQRRQEAAAAIRELRRGNVLGPDFSIRDLIQEGRRL